MSITGIPRSVHSEGNIMHRMTEDIKINNVMNIQDVSAGVNSSFVDMSEHRRALIVVQADPGEGETVTVTAKVSANADGSSPISLASPQTITGASGAVYIEVGTTELNSQGATIKYLGVTVTSAGDAVNAGAVIYQGEPRYRPASQALTGAVIE
jgi:hypothetical protein